MTTLCPSGRPPDPAAKDDSKVYTMLGYKEEERKRGIPISGPALCRRKLMNAIKHKNKMVKKQMAKAVGDGEIPGSLVVGNQF